jgi:hypothetical protein
MLGRVAVLAVAAMASAGCFGSNGHHGGVGGTTTHQGQARADLAVIRAALANGSGVLAPFRPARLGRRSCTIPRGGIADTRLVHAVCEARVLRKRSEQVVVLSENWNARDFRGSGERFRRPGSQQRLQTSWLLTLTRGGTVRRVTIRGDFPPQFVM